MTGWTSDGEVLAVSAAGQPETYLTWAYAVPLEGAPPRRLPFGPVDRPGAGGDGHGPAHRPDGQRARVLEALPRRHGGRLWTATADDPLFTRVLADLDGQLAGPMLVGGRLVFLSDHEGTGNIYSCALDGSDLRRHTDHDGLYARNPATDGQRIVYHVAGDIWLLDGLTRRSRAGSTSPWAPRPRPARRAWSPPRDHLGDLDCDQTGQASVVEVRGTVHWLTHPDGPARALSSIPAARARLPRVLGETGQVVWVTDAVGADALEIGSVTGEGPRPSGPSPRACSAT